MHQFLPPQPICGVVGFDNLLIHRPGNLQAGVVLINRPQGFKALVLLVGEEPAAGRKGFAVGLVGVLDRPCRTVVSRWIHCLQGGKFLGRHVRHVKGVHDFACYGSGFPTAGGIYGETLHRDNHDTVINLRGQLRKPANP